MLFAQAIELAMIEASATQPLEVTLTNFHDIVQRLEKTVGKTASCSVCPVTQQPLLTGSDPKRPSQVFVCCSIHKDDRPEYADVVLPAFPPIDQETLRLREAEFHQKVLQSRHPFGQPQSLWLCTVVLAACAGFIAHRLSGKQ